VGIGVRAGLDELHAAPMRRVNVFVHIIDADRGTAEAHGAAIGNLCRQPDRLDPKSRVSRRQAREMTRRARC
jgi:hypothetical protein